MKVKTCTKCHIKKSLSQFHISKAFKDWHNNWCKECMKTYHKQWYLIKGNKEKSLENNKNWVVKNREKARIKSNKWKKENRIHIRNYKRQYEQDKRNKDINYRIFKNLSVRINLALHGKDKALSTMFLIGCEIDYLMYHIQSQFKHGMTWDNYGEWHIDHIKPCVSFDFTKRKDQLECFNYKNLRPLWANINCGLNNRKF